VLPSGIIDSYKVLPKGKIFPRFRRCDVNIGKLIYFRERPNQRNYENATRKIMKEIARLSNQKYNY
jgi:1-acyl-sn-glycerol-3-phosphate acyltransferase